MLLTVDVGNSNTVLGVFDGDTLVHDWRIRTVPKATSDELSLTFHGLLADAPPIDGIAACSTVPAVMRELRRMCETAFGHIPAVLVEPGVKTGVPIRFDNPKEVGSDRIMNALAAGALYGGPAIVVDFGTSTNFDVINENREFIGGALAPGIDISVEALTARAAQLRKVELVRPPHAIAKNTVEALQSGAIFGFAGQVDGIVNRLAAELGGTPTVIATGGLAPLVLSESATIGVHEPTLTLIGLRLCFERNSGDIIASAGKDQRK